MKIWRGILWKAIQFHNSNGINLLDVVRVGDPPALPLGTADPDHLLWAEQAGRIIVTMDKNHDAWPPRAASTHWTHSPGIMIVRPSFTVMQLVHFPVDLRLTVAIQRTGKIELNSFPEGTLRYSFGWKDQEMRLHSRAASAFVVLIAHFCSTNLAQAQSIELAAIDTLVQDAVKSWQVPGAAVVVVRGDEVVYLKGVGVRELGSEKPVTPDTLFAIASTSKAFTAMAIAMQVSDGKMSWDDPVSKLHRVLSPFRSIGRSQLDHARPGHAPHWIEPA